MPAPIAASAPADAYRALLRKCLLARKPTDQLEKYLTQLLARTPLPAPAICDAVLAPSLTSNLSDPLHLDYVARLVERDIVSLANMLDGLLRASSVKAPTSTSPAASGENEYGSRQVLEQDVFLVLARVMRSHKPRSPEHVWVAVASMTAWMEAVMAVGSTGMLEDAAAVEVAADLSGKGRREALAELLMALAANQDAVRVLAEGGRKERRLSFHASLSVFTQYIQVTNPTLAAGLDTLRQLQSQSPPKGKTEPMDGIMIDLGDAPPAVWARGHLFIWLNSLLVAKPHVDDEAVVAYLYSRYRDDASTLLTDFITAVVDTVTNALVRNEPAPTLFMLRSFLTNKMPPLLARLSPSPVAASQALTQSFLRTDVSLLMNLLPSLFDPYTHTSSSHPDMLLIDLRQEFLFACALHHVISENEIQVILGELPLGALPNHGRYDAQDLLGQCAMDPGRVYRLLEEVENVDGNAGPVCVALFEIIKNMCDSRETMPLRNICSYLTRKPSSLDIMLLFVHAPAILDPLCELLDTWRYEEDQGEYQPVYEEFGSILLLVLTLFHRYALSPNDLTTTAPDSFVPQLLLHGATAQRMEVLGADRHAQLGGWIKELFEGEGISDGLMSSCRPQDFYRLVPTLFAQSILACDRGVIDLDTLKEGFSFLLEPFLLPSLVHGLSWLAQHVWSSSTDLPTPLQVLHSLLFLSPSTAPENAEIHRTVLSICARPLVRVLQDLQRQDRIQPAHRPIVDQMLGLLRPLTRFTRSAAATRDELEAWSSPSAGNPAAVGTTSTPVVGLCSVLSAAFANLLAWSLAPDDLPRPAVPYAPRLLPTTHRIAGAARTAHALAADVARARASAENNTAAARPGVAEDLAVACLTAYLPPGPGCSIVDALRWAQDEEDAAARGGIPADVVRDLIRAVDRAAVPYSPPVQRMEVDLGAGVGEVDLGALGGMGEVTGIGGGMEGNMEMEGLFVNGMDLDMELG